MSTFTTPRVAQLLGLVALAAACGGSPASPAAPAVFRESTLRIPQTWDADLDTGQVGPGPGIDIWFQAVRRPDERYLTPIAPATVAFIGASAPGATGCSSASLRTDAVPTQLLVAGVYLCARTNEGRLAQIRVIEPPAPFIDGAEIPAVTLHVVTYSR